MRTSNLKLITALSLIMLTGCNRNKKTFDINKDRKGGIFEIVENGKEYRIDNTNNTLALDTVTYISFADFEYIQREELPNEGAYSLNFKLNEDATSKFKGMTERNLNKPLAIVIDDKIIAAPTIQGAITTGWVSITYTNKNVIDEIINYLKLSEKSQ